MDWLALGCCTLIAGYVLYKFLAQQTANQGPAAPNEARTDVASPVKVELEQTSASAPQPTFQISTEEEPVSKEVSQVHARLPEAGKSISSGVQEMEQEPAKRLETPQASSKPTLQPPLIKPRSSSPPRLKPASFAAPPRPGNGFMRPPPSAAASLRVPPTKVLSNASMAPTSSIMPPGKQVSRKVVLEPGHSPLDWAALTSNPNSRLRGKDAPANLMRVTPARLKLQNGRKGRDAWTVYNGRVYNITPYVPFHPGGAGEIMRGAGKDSVKLFMEVHPWVNWDGMLSECLVGILVGDEEETDDRSGGLDDMD
ncbi:hypothetical protein ABEF95_013546 [Exophiala dermatitidis]